MDSLSSDNSTEFKNLNHRGLSVIQKYLHDIYNLIFNLDELKLIYAQMREDVCFFINQLEPAEASKRGYIPTTIRTLICNHLVAYFCGNVNGNLMVLGDRIREKQFEGTLFEKTYNVEKVFEYEKNKLENLKTDYYFFKIEDVCDFIEIKGSKNVVKKIMDYMLSEKDKINNLISFKNRLH